jgi:hypothetical protein
MLIATDYFMGRDRAYPQHLTDEIRTNAAELLGRVNLLLTWALRDNVRPAIDQRTISHVASGWRPPEINDATANAAKQSRHLTGEAIDLRDNGNRDLARWCLKSIDALEEIGLWMEDPQWTPSWVHLQIVPPGSRRRVYCPSSKPALVARLPEQEGQGVA